ncbi:MAG: hypothetical protein ACTSYT_00985 [Candidatus Asgardarchaeia archaeon]
MSIIRTFKNKLLGLFQEESYVVKKDLSPKEFEMRKSMFLEYLRLIKAKEKLKCLGEDVTFLYKNGYVEKGFFNKVMITIMRVTQDVVPKIGILKTKLLSLGISKKVLEEISHNTNKIPEKLLHTLGISTDITRKL